MQWYLWVLTYSGVSLLFPPVSVFDLASGVRNFPRSLFSESGRTHRVIHIMKYVRGEMMMRCCRKNRLGFAPLALLYVIRFVWLVLANFPPFLLHPYSNCVEIHFQQVDRNPFPVDGAIIVRVPSGFLQSLRWISPTLSGNRNRVRRENVLPQIFPPVPKGSHFYAIFHRLPPAIFIFRKMQSLNEDLSLDQFLATMSVRNEIC
jgi:hypothetical protein